MKIEDLNAVELPVKLVTNSSEIKEEYNEITVTNFNQSTMLILNRDGQEDSMEIENLPYFREADTIESKTITKWIYVLPEGHSITSNYMLDCDNPLAKRAIIEDRITLNYDINVTTGEVVKHEIKR